MISRFFRSSVDALQSDAWECLEIGRYKRALQKGRRLIKKRHSSGFEICAVAFTGLQDRENAIVILRRMSSGTAKRTRQIRHPGFAEAL
jgi:hypothetical protein